MNHRPDFLCIGYPKTGTTWLASSLRRHPDIYIHPAKEVNYHWGMITSQRWYSEYLKNPLLRPLANYNLNLKRNVLRRWKAEMSVQQKPFLKSENWRMLLYFSPLQIPYLYKLQFDPFKLSGDLTPGYISKYTTREIKLVVKHNPTIKVMIRMRNPIEQAWSLAKMTHTARNKKGYRGTQDFDVIFKNCYSNILDCENRIDLWKNFIPAENIHLSYYEDLVIDPEAHLASILNFLELPFPKSKAYRDPLKSKVYVGKKDHHFPLDLRQEAAEEILQHLPAMKKTFESRIVDLWTERTKKIASDPLVR